MYVFQCTEGRRHLIKTLPASFPRSENDEDCLKEYQVQKCESKAMVLFYFLFLWLALGCCCRTRTKRKSTRSLYSSEFDATSTSTVERWPMNLFQKDISACMYLVR